MNRAFYIKRNGLFVPDVARMNPAFLGSFKKPASGGGGGGGSNFTFLASATAHASSNTMATAGPINTTGAKLIVAYLLNYNDDTRIFADSQSNTWTAGTIYSSGAGVGMAQIRYCISPTTNAAHTFNWTDNYVVLGIEAYSYSGTTPSINGTSGQADAGSGWTTIQPGSITPAGATGLFVTCAVGTGAGSVTFSINSSFATPIQAMDSNMVGACSHKIHTASSSAENPTWTSPTAGVFGGAAMMHFQ